MENTSLNLTDTDILNHNESIKVEQTDKKQNKEQLFNELIKDRDKIIAAKSYKIQNCNYSDFTDRKMIFCHETLLNPDIVTIFPAVEEYEVETNLRRYPDNVEQDKQYEYQIVMPLPMSHTFAIKLPSDLGRYDVYRDNVLLGTSDECGYCYLKKDDYEFKEKEKRDKSSRYFVSIFGQSNIEQNVFDSVTIKFKERVRVQVVFSLVSREVLISKNILFDEVEQVMTIKCILSRRNIIVCSDGISVYRYSN